MISWAVSHGPGDLRVGVDPRDCPTLPLHEFAAKRNLILNGCSALEAATVSGPGEGTGGASRTSGMCQTMPASWSSRAPWGSSSIGRRSSAISRARSRVSSPPTRSADISGGSDARARALTRLRPRCSKCHLPARVRSMTRSPSHTPTIDLPRAPNVTSFIFHLQGNARGHMARARGNLRAPAFLVLVAATCHVQTRAAKPSSGCS